MKNRTVTHAFSAWSAFAAFPNITLALVCKYTSVCSTLGCSRGPWMFWHRDERCRAPTKAASPGKNKGSNNLFTIHSFIPALRCSALLEDILVEEFIPSQLKTKKKQVKGAKHSSLP